MKRLTGILIVLALVLNIKIAFAQADEFMKQGKQAMFTGQYELAIEKFTRALDFQPANQQALYDRGMSKLYLNEFQPAIDDFNKVLEIDPNDPDAYNARGLCYGYIGRPDEAINDFERAVQIDPEFAEAFINRGSAYVAMRKFDKALKDFNRALELDPKNPSLYFQRGRSNYLTGKFSDAVRDFTKSLELGLRKSKVYYNRGNSYYKMNQFQKAIEDYNKAIDLNPADDEAINNRAMAYEKMGKRDLAEKDRGKLNKMSGNKYPPLDEITFKRYYGPDKLFSIEMPEDWFAIENVSDNAYDLVLTPEKLDGYGEPYSTGVRISYNKDMYEFANVDNEQELLNFWDGSTAKNAAEYHIYNIFRQKHKFIAGHPSMVNEIRITVEKNMIPLQLYEWATTREDVLVYAYLQSPEKVFGYYRKIFDKAIKSIRIKDAAN